MIDDGPADSGHATAQDLQTIKPKSFAQQVWGMIGNMAQRSHDSGTTPIESATMQHASQHVPATACEPPEKKPCTASAALNTQLRQISRSYAHYREASLWHLQGITEKLPAQLDSLTCSIKSQQQQDGGQDHLACSALAKCTKQIEVLAELLAAADELLPSS